MTWRPPSPPLAKRDASEVKATGDRLGLVREEVRKIFGYSIDECTVLKTVVLPV